MNQLCDERKNGGDSHPFIKAGGDEEEMKK